MSDQLKKNIKLLDQIIIIDLQQISYIKKLLANDMPGDLRILFSDSLESYQNDLKSMMNLKQKWIKKL